MVNICHNYYIYKVHSASSLTLSNWERNYSHDYGDKVTFRDNYNNYNPNKIKRIKSLYSRK